MLEGVIEESHPEVPVAEGTACSVQPFPRKSGAISEASSTLPAFAGQNPPVEDLSATWEDFPGGCLDAQSLKLAWVFCTPPGSLLLRGEARPVGVTPSAAPREGDSLRRLRGPSARCQAS